MSSAATGAGPPERNNLQRSWRVFVRRKIAVAAGAALVLLAVIAVWGTRLAPYNPDRQNYDEILKPPSTAHLMGTDKFGRDIFSRVLAGAHLTLGVGLGAVGIGIVIGLPLGLTTGYYGGWYDNLVNRVFDIILAFPGLLVSIGIVALLGTGLTNALIAVGVFTIPIFARVVRSQAILLRGADYVQAARSLGASDLRIVMQHVLPNSLSAILVIVTLRTAQAILAVASLSFLGLGVQPPTSEWGVMLADGRELLTSAPWVSSAPGLMIFLAVLSLNLLGDGIGDALDPRLARQL